VIRAYFGGWRVRHASKQKSRPGSRQGGFVTPSGFLSCIDIQYVEYFVDLKAKNWVNFTRVYSDKSGFTKVGEKIRG